MGLVAQVFDDRVLQSLPGQMAVGHTRYSTTGSSHVGNAQPAIVPTRLGIWPWPTMVIWSIPPLCGRNCCNGTTT
jgi:hypothetical protein